MKQPNYQRSLKLLKLEAILTGMVFSMPIINVFYKDELGMSLAQVGISQAVFTAAVLMFNIPTGWLADRFSRRACNLLGDILEASAFLYYAFAHTFADVIIAEIVIGVGIAFSSGADVALFRAYADKLKISYDTISAQTNKLRTVGELFAVAIGGFVGSYQPRVAIALSALSCGAGAVLSWFIDEAGERRKAVDHNGNHIHPVRDMIAITRYALHGHKPLAWRIFGFAAGRNATHALVWMLTPLLILAGVPLPIIGVAWMINLVAVWIGSWAAERTTMKLHDWQQFMVGAGVFTVAAAGLSINVSLATIGLYAGFGFVRGWYASTLSPIVQRHTPDDMQSTVVSVAGSMGNLVYIPLVWGFSALGDRSPQVSVLGNLLLFTPLLALITYKLYQLEKR